MLPTAWPVRWASTLAVDGPSSLSRLSSRRRSGCVIAASTRERLPLLPAQVGLRAFRLARGIVLARLPMPLAEHPICADVPQRAGGRGGRRHRRIAEAAG